MTAATMINIMMISVIIFSCDLIGFVLKVLGYAYDAPLPLPGGYDRIPTAP